MKEFSIHAVIYSSRLSACLADRLKPIKIRAASFELEFNSFELAAFVLNWLQRVSFKKRESNLANEHLFL